MDTKHTNGPWRLDDSLHAHVISDNYHFIDSGRGFHPEGFSLAAHTTLANARLIAAAPDLLAALESICLPDEGYAYDLETLKRARVAIAKARGES